MNARPWLLGEKSLKVTFFLCLFILSGGLHDLWVVVLLIIRQFQTNGTGIFLPFGIDLQVPPNPSTAPLLVKSVASGVLAQFFLPKLLVHVDERIRQFQTAHEAGKRELQLQYLLEMLDQKSGIKQVYPWQGSKQRVIGQEYAADMIEVLRKSERVRVLSIAGYEYIGKGQKSLLLREIEKRPSLEVEVIILDPKKGHHVLDQRASELRKRDANYSVGNLSHEIEETIRQITRLKAERKDVPNAGAIALYLTKQRPPFRLVIFDSCLFLSTYEKGQHGHETPVYRLQKAPDDADGQLSLYPAFVTLFDNTKRSSEAALERRRSPLAEVETSPDGDRRF